MGIAKFYDGPRIENFEETNYFTRVLVREKDKDYPLNFSKTRVSKDELKLVFEDKKRWLGFLNQQSLPKHMNFSRQCV